MRTESEIRQKRDNIMNQLKELHSYDDEYAGKSEIDQINHDHDCMERAMMFGILNWVLEEKITSKDFTKTRI